MSNYYTPAISTGKLQVDGNVYIGVDVSGNVVDASGITSSLRAVEVNANVVSATTINASTLSYSSLDLSGNLTVGGNLTVDGTVSIGEISFQNLDLSGNLTVAGDSHFSGAVVMDNDLIVTGNSTLNTAYIEYLEVGTLVIDTSGTDKADLDVSGNLTVGGVITSNTINNSGSINSSTFSTNAGFEVDSMGNVVVPGSISNLAGFEVDSMGNVVVPGSISNLAGSSVDASGDLIVMGSTSLESLDVAGQTSLNANVNIGENLAVQGGEYVAGGLYVNNGVTVGDSMNGPGVTMDSSGSVLTVFSNDASMNVLPATIVVENISVLGALSADNLDVSGQITSGSLFTDTIETMGGFEVDATGNVIIPGSITSNSGFEVDSMGNVSIPGTVSTDSGFSIDVSGNLVVMGSSSLKSLSVAGQTSLNANVNITQNLAVQGGEYIGGGLYVNNGVTVGDGALGNGVIMESSGSVLTVFSKDASMNVLPATIDVENIIAASGMIDALTSVTIQTDAGFEVDASGNVVIPGTITADSGFEVDATGNVVIPGSITSNSGFEVDATGNVMIPGTVETDSGFTIDASGNVVVAGNTTVQALLANGQVSLQHNMDVVENVAVEGGQYIAGGLYVNNKLTVGDSIDGDGVTMDVSGTVLSVYSQDSSMNVYPATLNIDNITVRTHFNTTTPTAAPTITDSSNIISSLIFGSDVAGTIIFSPDGSGEPYVTITFGTPYTNVSGTIIVMITPANKEAVSSVDVGYVSTADNYGFTVAVSGNSSSSIFYRFNYFVIG